MRQQASGRRRAADPAANRRCRSCGASFVGESWQRWCWPCWREQRDEQDREAAYQQGYSQGYAAAARDARAVFRARRPAIDEDLLLAAIRLAHPDSHPAERFELANQTTSRLLALRSELAG